MEGVVCLYLVRLGAYIHDRNIRVRLYVYIVDVLNGVSKKKVLNAQNLTLALPPKV
jgi:hypothetical protein